MRTISFMYQASGGADAGNGYNNRCNACRYFSKEKPADKYGICGKYEELGGDKDTPWYPTWTACRFFEKTGKKQQTRNTRTLTTEKRKPKAKKGKALRTAVVRLFPKGEDGQLSLFLDN